MTLRTLLLIALLGIGLAPAGVLIATTQPGVVAAFRDGASAQALGRARAQASELNLRLERRKETVRNVALLPAPLEMLNAVGGEGGGLYLSVQQAAERLTGVMRRWFARAEDFRRLVLLDPAGRELLRLDRTPQGILRVQSPTSLANESPELFRAALSGGGDGVRAAVVGEDRRLRLFAPVRSLETQTVGALAMEFDLHDVLGASANAAWVDAAGTYIHEGPADARAGDAFLHHPALKGAAAAAVLSQRAEAATAWVRLHLDGTAGNVLWIGTPVDPSALEAWLWDLRAKQLAVVLALAASLAAAVRLVALRMDRIKRAMMDGLRRAIAGDETVRFDWRGPPEVRALGEELTRLVELHGAEMAGRQTAERQLAQEKEVAEITLQSITDGVLTTDAEGRIGYVNPAAQRLLDRSAAQVEGQMADTVLVLSHEVRRTPLANPVPVCLRSHGRCDVDQDAVLLRHDGSEVAVEMSAAPMHDADGRVAGAVVAIRDVAQERQLRRLLAHQASHDPLTGLINRRAFEERLKTALDEAHERDAGHPQWLCYADLDQFKLINDTCGHLAGDELLKQVARDLRVAVRDGDVVSRMGGDEFGVLLRPCTREVAYEIAERMRQSLAGLRFAWRNQSFTTSGSFGLVAVQEGGGSVYDLLSAADRACYVAKDSGRNRIHLADSHDAATQKLGGEMEWAHATMRALEEDRLVLYWQAIRPLQPGAGASHAEILVRMRTPDGTLVPPGAFIPAAERYNLMRDVDRWVIRRTIKAFRGRADFQGVIAVNLSAQSLCDDDFLGFVLAELDESGFRPDRLCFEVTETAAMSNLTRAQEVMRALKGRGCRFALDDFGSGLSSFGYLKNLAIDYLKIDGSFVRHIVEDRLDRAFVQSINDIGHLMGLSTIAEYVETPEIEEVLRTLGVDYAQGYGVAMPEPLETLLAAESPVGTPLHNPYEDTLMRNF